MQHEGRLSKKVIINNFNSKLAFNEDDIEGNLGVAIKGKTLELL